MAALFITCRVTGLQVDTGIEMDEATFSTLPNLPMNTACPRCGHEHVWWTRSAQLDRVRPMPSMWLDLRHEDRQTS